MPKTGDKFTVSLRKSHIGWGTERKKQTRKPIPGEGYLPIPSKYAKAMDITNSNGNSNTHYVCNSSDGKLKNEILLASGASRKGYKYAKNFAGKGNLKLLGSWFTQIGAKVGDRIEIEFTSPTELLITKL